MTGTCGPAASAAGGAARRGSGIGINNEIYRILGIDGVYREQVMRGLIVCMLVLALWAPLWASRAAAAEKRNQRIVVWRLEAKSGVSKADVASLSGYISTEVERSSGLRVISEGDVDTMLKGEEKRQQCGGGDAGCIAEIGNALGVPEAVSGDLGRVGEFWFLNLRRIDVRHAEVIKRSSRKVRGDINAMIEVIAPAVAELFEGVEPPATPTPAGTLSVDSDPSGATVLMDGTALGTTPCASEAPAGKHGVEVHLQGYERETQSVIVQPEQTTGLSLKLKREYPMNPYKKWGHISFWSGLGVTALAGGIGFGLGAKYADDYQNQTSGSINSLRDTSETMTGLGYAGIALGGAMMITGVVLWVLSPGDESWWRDHQPGVGVAGDGDAAVLSFSGRW